MKFKDSPYYNKDLLSESFYYSIGNKSEIFTVQEYFRLNDNQKEYHVKDEYKDYNLNVFDNYYELDCQKNQSYLYLVFDKPVRITGTYCIGFIAPEIIVKSNLNISLEYCVANKVTVNNDYNDSYAVRSSKANNVHFYNKKIFLNKSEINNLFVFHPNLEFSIVSIFLGYHKIKCFGECDDLKKKISNYELFKERIIHIE